MSISLPAAGPAITGTAPVPASASPQEAPEQGTEAESSFLSLLQAALSAGVLAHPASIAATPSSTSGLTVECPPVQLSCAMSCLALSRNRATFASLMSS